MRLLLLLLFPQLPALPAFQSTRRTARSRILCDKSEWMQLVLKPSLASQLIPNFSQPSCRGMLGFPAGFPKCPMRCRHAGQEDAATEGLFANYEIPSFIFFSFYLACSVWYLPTGLGTGKCPFAQCRSGTQLQIEREGGKKGRSRLHLQ